MKLMREKPQDKGVQKEIREHGLVVRASPNLKTFLLACEKQLKLIDDWINV